MRSRILYYLKRYFQFLVLHVTHTKNEDSWTHVISFIPTSLNSQCLHAGKGYRTEVVYYKVSPVLKQILFIFLKDGWSSVLYLAETSHWLPSCTSLPRWYWVRFCPNILAPGLTRLLFFVHLHVLPKMRALAEALATFTALVGLLPRVGSLMLNKVGTLAETAATLITLIGLFSSMNSLVLNEIRALFKAFSTLITLIGLLPGMDPSMLNEIRTLKETFPTISTSIGFLSSMDLLMLKKSWALTETLFTFSTFIGLLIQASSQSTQVWDKWNSHSPFLPLPDGFALVLRGFSVAWAPRNTTLRFS